MATKHTITISITQVHEIEIISEQPAEEFDAMDMFQEYLSLITAGDTDFFIKEKINWEHDSIEIN